MKGNMPVNWQNQARRLPRVHPGYSTTTSRKKLTPASLLQGRAKRRPKGTLRYPQNTIFHLRDASHGKHVG
ncbi:hypothetical protein TNCV_3692661 [Trichonephila clavipes]|nr:hypothetical protein TNCV_3692661 [Trichonephila clavipes]